MAKLNREAFMLYVDANFGAAKAADSSSSTHNWVLIGDDIEELTTELNPDTETLKNILGQTKTKDNGYEPSTDADPFYADPDNALYKTLRDIALGRKKGDDCKTQTLEVIIEDTVDSNHLAYTQEVIVKPQSYGGDTAGFNIPFNISENGARVKGYVSLANGVPTFTAGEIPTDSTSSVEREESLS